MHCPEIGIDAHNEDSTKVQAIYPHGVISLLRGSQREKAHNGCILNS